MDTVAARLAPEVTHRGVRADLVCPDRESVLANMRARSEVLPAVEALELVAAGDRVVMSVRAAGIGQPVRDEDAPPRSGVDRLHPARRPDHGHAGLPSRAEALAAAGAGVRQWE